MDRTERLHEIVERLNRPRAAARTDRLRGRWRFDGPVSASCIGDAG